MIMNLFGNWCPVSLNHHSWFLIDQQKSGCEDLEIFKLNRPNHMSISIDEIDLYVDYPAEPSHMFLVRFLFDCS